MNPWPGPLRTRRPKVPLWLGMMLGAAIAGVAAAAWLGWQVGVLTWASPTLPGLLLPLALVRTWALRAALVAIVVHGTLRADALPSRFALLVLVPAAALLALAGGLTAAYPWLRGDLVAGITRLEPEDLWFVSISTAAAAATLSAARPTWIVLARRSRWAAFVVIGGMLAVVLALAQVLLVP